MAANTCADKEPFVLRVIGTSMLPEFEEGSIIVVDPGQPVRDGDFVVARMQNETQLGRLSVKDNIWYLTTTSSSCDDAVVTSSEQILGRVTKRTDAKRKSSRNFS